MKVLVAGANGQLGWELLRTAPAGWSVLGLDHQQWDITRAEEVMARITHWQPQWVINAAAFTAVDEAESRPQEAAAVNVTGVANLALAARHIGARLLHISTDYVFNGQRGTPWRPQDIVAPLGVYGRTKAQGEAVAMDILGDHALILRSAWIYSVHGRNFVHTLLRLMRERQEVGVVADQIGTPTWAYHLAQALWHLIAADARGILHWTNAGAASWYDFAMVIRQQALTLELIPHPAIIRPIPATAYPLPARRPAFSVLDSTAAWEILGTSAPHWMAGVAGMLQEVAGGRGGSSPPAGSGDLSP